LAVKEGRKSGFYTITEGIKEGKRRDLGNRKEKAEH